MELIEYHRENIEGKLIEISNGLPTTNTLGLYTGEAGKMLFYAYLSVYFKEEKYFDEVEIIIQNIISKLNKSSLNNTYCSGVSGILWGIEHLSKGKFVELEERFISMVSPLEKSALLYANASDFDFLHGSGGIIYYLLDSELANVYTINEWLNILEKKAIKIKDKIVWETVIDVETGKKAYNLCLSHGISSTIVILSEIIRKFPDNKLAHDLLNGSINYLLSCKNDNAQGSIFPSYIAKEKNVHSETSRLAWCYGDLGNAIALWKAGVLLNNERWKKESIQIMVHASERRDLNSNGVIDGGFCHGTAGIAHIFNRFYKETKLKEFDKARWYWLERTLEMAHWGDGIAGYKARLGKKGLQNESNLLEGVVGIGMVLLGFLTEDLEDISWDRCLMLS